MALPWNKNEERTVLFIIFYSNSNITENGSRINIFGLIFNILFPNSSPYKRIDCFNNADWPKEKKDEINNAIKKCLEVFVLYLFISFEKFIYKNL